MKHNAAFQRNAKPRQPGHGHPIPHYVYIETSNQLAAFCRFLSPDGPVALDTEFVGENTYVPVLELIQLADAAGRIALIDVQTVRDWSPLAPVLSDPARPKLFHSAKQDVALLHRLLGVAPVPIFDTQTAAAMVGLGAQMSYVNLLRSVLGVSIKGAETVSDWSKRPLDAGQLVYAAQDVQYLHSLYEELQSRVEAKGRAAWLREELDRRAGSFLEGDPTPDDERFRQVRDWVKLDGLELAILRELAAWREQEARRRNLSRRAVLSDEGLVMLARKAPETRAEVNDLRRVNAGQLYRCLDDILHVIRRAKSIPKDQWPEKRPPQRPDIPEGLIELFQAIVRATADQESIAPVLLSTREELTALAIRRHDLDALDLPVLHGWRREMIGDRLLALLDGRMHLRIEERNRVVIDEK